MRNLRPLKDIKITEFNYDYLSNEPEVVPVFTMSSNLLLKKKSSKNKKKHKSKCKEFEIVQDVNKDLQKKIMLLKSRMKCDDDDMKDQEWIVHVSAQVLISCKKEWWMKGKAN